MSCRVPHPCRISVNQDRVRPLRGSVTDRARGARSRAACHRNGPSRTDRIRKGLDLLGSVSTGGFVIDSWTGRSRPLSQRRSLTRRGLHGLWRACTKTTLSCATAPTITTPVPASSSIPQPVAVSEYPTEAGQSELTTYSTRALRSAGSPEPPRCARRCWPAAC